MWIPTRPVALEYQATQTRPVPSTPIAGWYEQHPPSCPCRSAPFAAEASRNAPRTPAWLFATTMPPPGRPTASISPLIAVEMGVAVPGAPSVSGELSYTASLPAVVPPLITRSPDGEPPTDQARTAGDVGEARQRESDRAGTGQRLRRRRGEPAERDRAREIEPDPEGHAATRDRC